MGFRVAKPLPLVRLNLDLPPEERWKELVAPYKDDLLAKARSLARPASIDMCKHITTATETCMHYAIERPREVYKGSAYGASFTQFARGLPLYTDDPDGLLGSFICGMRSALLRNSSAERGG